MIKTKYMTSIIEEKLYTRQLILIDVLSERVSL